MYLCLNFCSNSAFTFSWMFLISINIIYVKYVEVLARLSDNYLLKYKTMSKLHEPMTALPKYTFKVVLMGDEGVGKTSIINRFSQDEFRLSQDVLPANSAHSRSRLLWYKCTARGHKLSSAVMGHFWELSFSVTSSQLYKGFCLWLVCVRSH